jgi:hypothetical protein
MNGGGSCESAESLLYCINAITEGILVLLLGIYQNRGAGTVCKFCMWMDICTIWRRIRV